MEIAGRDRPLFALPRLEIASGSRLLIEGPSGSGKSTFLHLLAGQFLPARGRIAVGGQVLTGMDDEARARFRRKHVGILFQRFNLLGHLTALENVLLGPAAPTPSDAARAEAALERLGIAGLRDRTAAGFSPGESQRVAAARLLARPPDLLLADEPTSSLDGPNADAVLDALLEASRGRTLVVVSHDPRARGRFDEARDFRSLVSA
jgi:putative ABC transport system ATP-binding protein